MSSKNTKSKTGTYNRPKKNFNKSVREIVQKELADEIEQKHAITENFSPNIKRNIP